MLFLIVSFAALLPTVQHHTFKKLRQFLTPAFFHGRSAFWMHTFVHVYRHRKWNKNGVEWGNKVKNKRAFSKFLDAEYPGISRLFNL